MWRNLRNGILAKLLDNQKRIKNIKIEYITEAHCFCCRSIMPFSLFPVSTPLPILSPEPTALKALWRDITSFETFWDQGPHSQRDSISDRRVKTGALLIAQIHGYLLGLKSIKTLIVGLQKI